MGLLRLVRLGWRLSFGSGRSGRLRFALMVSGATLAAFVVLTAVSLSGLAQRQSDRARHLAPREAPAAASSLHGTVIADGWGDVELRRIVVAADGPDAPVPPGLDRLPGPGEVALSPGLADLVEREPLVARRFPQRHVATIGDEGLVEPRQLVAYVGVGDVGGIWRPSAIAGWGQTNAQTAVDPRAARTVGLLVVVTLVAPVVLFMVTCARLSATARAQRLAALRLVGLSPWRTQVVNAVEARVVGVVGTGTGLAAWLAWRHLDPAVQVGSLGWFSSDLRLSPSTMALVLAGLVALSITVGVLGGRAAVGQPLAVRRERAVRSLSPWRAAPLPIGIALLTACWIASGRHARFTAWAAPYGLGLLGVGVGLVLVVPFASRALGWVIGRSRRPAAVLAAGRLRHEPAVAGRVVATMAVALFAAGFAQVVLTSVSEASANRNEFPIGPVYNLTAYGTSTDGARYGGLSPYRLALPQWRIGELTAVGATCAQLGVATGDRVTGCRDGQVQRVPALDRLSPGADPAAVDRAVVAAGLPKPTGELSAIAPRSGSSPVEVVVPPALAPVTTSFVVPFPGSTYDPQVAVARLAAVDPGGQWSEEVTGVYREDTGRLYTGLVAIGTASALLVSLAALVVATLDRAIERAGAQARLAALGTPARTIRSATALQVLPVSMLLLISAGVAAALGGSSFLRWGDVAHPLPSALILGLTALAVGGALLATVAAVVATVARPRADLLRAE